MALLLKKMFSSYLTKRIGGRGRGMVGDEGEGITFNLEMNTKTVLLACGCFSLMLNIPDIMIAQTYTFFFFWNKYFEIPFSINSTSFCIEFALIHMVFAS